MSIAEFAFHNGREWLLHGAFDALYREGLGEPVYLVESLRPYMLWLVADPIDAIRLETAGFPSLPSEGLSAIAPEDIAPWVILLQRPGEEESLAGVDCRAELLEVGWTGTLTAIELPFDDLQTATEECSAGLGTFLVALLADADSQTLVGDVRDERSTLYSGERQRSAKNNRCRAHAPQVGSRGFRTIAAGEAPSWRK